MRELISKSTRGLFRDLMTDSSVGAISGAFHDEGFAPNPDTRYEDSSVRRTTTQEHLESVNWSDVNHVNRVLQVFERLLVNWEGPLVQRFYNSLRRDGCPVDADTGLITPLPPTAGRALAIGSMDALTDPSAIQDQLDRIQRAIIDDPAQAIGSAKELIESTAKVVLTECGLPVNEKDDLPALAKAAQEALGLHPSASMPGPDGSDAVKKILGAVSTIAAGLAELRNRGYGTGHGPVAARVGLRTRHAHLAVNAAVTWCQLLLDTLADPEAPWHKNAGT